MNPIKAQRTWHSLSTKWINSVPFGRGKPLRNSRRKVASRMKKGFWSNLIQVEVVNAITGEVHKGYMRELSSRRLKKWLEFHNHRAQVEQIYLSPKTTLAALTEEEIKEFPILIKLRKYQVPYLIEASRLDAIIRKRQTLAFNLKTVDNLKYLETVAAKKEKVMKLFDALKKNKKK